MKTLPLAAPILAFSLLANAAQAHIVFSQTQASPGSSYYGALRVGHGCDGSPTVSLSVTLPEGVLAAKPQPKPGWTLTIDHAPLTTPGEGGQPLVMRVTRVTWSGGALPDDQFDEFGVTFKLPAGEGPIYFPTIQTCAAGHNDWVQIPAPGKAWMSVPRPAPVIDLRVDAAPPRTAAPAMNMPGMDMR